MLPAVLLAAVVVGCQGANFFHFLFFFFLSAVLLLTVYR